MTRKTALSLSLLFAVGMLLFTFITFAWFSDSQGFEVGFEIPVGTENGIVSTLADAVWMASPFLLVLSHLFFSFGKGGEKIGLLLSALPLFLYAILRILSYLGGKESHPILFFTLFSLILIASFSSVAAFVPEAKKSAAIIVFSYGAAETLLLIFSMLFQEKYSLFYFSQLIPMGHTSYLRYSFFTISTFFYYLFYALGLGFRLLPLKEKEIKPKEIKIEEIKTEEIEEEDLSSLSLEDLGISR
ncbi:MAG: hypothetical protein IKU24_05915 [Clostridia bacterium]|nr:hypothetical protein [Clostridia bacterium]